MNYKGFDKDLKCRGFQYEIGKEYECAAAVACETGFHACERPLDVFSYYPPASSRYCEVEQSGETNASSNDSKVASTKIKIGAEIGIPGLVKAQIEYVKAHTTTEHTDPKAATAGNSGAATAGDWGAATAGYSGAATAGNRGAATAGDWGAATAGYRGAATAGDSGAATAGDCGAATAGDWGAATAGDCGAATAGNSGAATAGDCGAATAGARGAATAGNRGAATAGNSGTATAGASGAATAGASGAATAGDWGAATAGYRGAATAGDSGAATAGDWGYALSGGNSACGKNGVAVVRGTDPKAKGGIGAVLVLVKTADDGEIEILKTVKVDGEKVKADTWYTVKGNRLAEVKE